MIAMTGLSIRPPVRPRPGSGSLCARPAPRAGAWGSVADIVRGFYSAGVAMGADSPALRVGYLDGGLYVHVNGRATQRLCPTLEHLVQTFVEAHPQGPAITLDLDSCAWVDSTFAGWLLGVRRQLQPCGGRLRLSGVSERCRASLARMQLQTLFEFVAVTAPAETSIVNCATGDRPDRETLEIMLRAHEFLAAVGGDNARVFNPVIDVLRKQLGQAKEDSR